jgi:hypothetical protein
MPPPSELAVYETFEDVFLRRSTLDELIADLRRFSQQSVLWVCAAIVTGIQLWNRPNLQPSDIYERFLSTFFHGALRTRFIAGYWSTDPRRFLFHRRQILLISKLAILHCSGHGLDARFSAEQFGPILLKANDHLHYGLIPNEPGRRVTTREDFAKIITEMVAVGEHASPNVADMVTRSHLMLTRFAKELSDHPDFVDLNGEYRKATDLTIEELEAMLFGVHARFGEELVRKLMHQPGSLPLRDANFASTAVPAEKVRSFLDSLSADPGTMSMELKQKDDGPNDFTVFRKFPLVRQYYNMHLRTASSGFLMMDNLFFLEKIQTAPYWNAAAFGERLHRFWGVVFEKYVNELMMRACAGTKAKYIPDPRHPDHPSAQICDGIVVSDDSMVLLEYKSNMFRADTKYSGNHLELAAEIEMKLVHNTTDKKNKKKGVWQLSHALKTLFNQNASMSLLGIDLRNIKRVYPYLVTFDSIGATIGISPFLNTFLEEHLHGQPFSIEVRPLFCTDIETLEFASGFFGASSLPQVLEHWFETNPSLTTPLQAIDLSRFAWRENGWLRAEWNSVYKSMVKILFPDKDPEAALADAVMRAKGLP